MSGASGNRRYIVGLMRYERSALSVTGLFCHTRTALQLYAADLFSLERF